VSGKVFATLAHGRPVVKIPPSQAAAMVTAGEGAPFEPRPGRREWVTVEPPLGQAPERWRELVDDARSQAAALTDPSPAAHRPATTRPGRER